MASKRQTSITSFRRAAMDYWGKTGGLMEFPLKVAIVRAAPDGSAALFMNKEGSGEEIRIGKITAVLPNKKGSGGLVLCSGGGEQTLCRVERVSAPKSDQTPPALFEGKRRPLEVLRDRGNLPYSLASRPEKDSSGNPIVIAIKTSAAPPPLSLVDCSLIRFSDGGRIDDNTNFVSIVGINPEGETVSIGSIVRADIPNHQVFVCGSQNKNVRIKVRSWAPGVAENLPEKYRGLAEEQSAPSPSAPPAPPAAA